MQICKDNGRVTCLAENHVVVTVVVVVELVAANLGAANLVVVVELVAANLVTVVELIADIKQPKTNNKQQTTTASNICMHV